MAINITGSWNLAGAFTASAFKGDGSAITGITAAGSGSSVMSQSVLLGTAAVLNFTGSAINASFSNSTASISVISPVTQQSIHDYKVDNPDFVYAIDTPNITSSFFISASGHHRFSASFAGAASTASLNIYVCPDQFAVGESAVISYFVASGSGVAYRVKLLQSASDVSTNGVWWASIPTTNPPGGTVTNVTRTAWDQVTFGSSAAVAMRFYKYNATSSFVNLVDFGTQRSTIYRYTGSVGTPQ
jgi:hypothetical protein